MSRTYTNPGPITFTAAIQRNTEVDNSSAWIEFPFDLKATYGVGNLVPYKAVFDGRVEYRGSLAKMGGPQAMVLLRKDVREALGKQPGEMVDVVVELDDSPREVVIPEDLRAALETAGVLDVFEALAFSHRREFVKWVEEAKRTETRAARLAKTCEMVAAKQHRS